MKVPDNIDEYVAWAKAHPEEYKAHMEEFKESLKEYDRWIAALEKQNKELRK